jgi:branched-chain amino acid transport system ATP-binding protein
MYFLGTQEETSLFTSVWAKAPVGHVVGGLWPADVDGAGFEKYMKAKLGPMGWKVARMGLGRTFQVPRPLGDLTVFENALVGAMRAGGMRGRHAYGAAYEALALTGMTGQANTRSSALRLLDRKRLELARALAMRPKVLLLDEIAGGLSDPETEILIETIRSVNAGGTTIVWVEHVIRVLTAVSTRLVCLADGRVLADGRPAEVLASDEVRASFLGGGALGGGVL